MNAEIKIKKYFYGIGRRKTAVARIRIFEGEKICKINEKDVEMNAFISKPFELVGKKGCFGISVMVSGGGKMSQQESIRHGITRALVVYNPEFRLSLKKAGFLRRDPRAVERKKPGLKKARRAPQWSKR